MDLRNVEGFMLRARFIRSTVLALIALAVVGRIAVANLAPSTRTVTRTVTRAITRTVVEPRYRVQPVGAMTAQEFNSIQIGETADAVAADFGEPLANAPNDEKSFYPAAGGGTYWVFYRGCGGDCQKVSGKSYVR